MFKDIHKNVSMIQTSRTRFVIFFDDQPAVAVYKACKINEDWFNHFKDPSQRSWFIPSHSPDEDDSCDLCYHAKRGTYLPRDHKKLKGQS